MEENIEWTMQERAQYSFGKKCKFPTDFWESLAHGHYNWGKSIGNTIEKLEPMYHKAHVNCRRSRAPLKPPTRVIKGTTKSKQKQVIVDPDKQSTKMK